MAIVKIAFSQTGSVTSRMIRWFTRSEWSHVDLVMEDGSLLGALPFKGVVMRKPSKAKGKVDYKSVVVPNDQAGNIYSFSRRQLGKKYDWAAIISFVSRGDWQKEGKWFCSELVAASFKKGGVDLLNTRKSRVTPRDLYISPLLKD